MATQGGVEVNAQGSVLLCMASPRGFYTRLGACMVTCVVGQHLRCDT